jgi:CheY-like chemotaxis protein
LEVLLVEDNPTDAELAMLAIRHAGYPGKVIHVETGTKALDYLSAAGEFEGRQPRPPRVIFLDLKLPGMDGIEVLQRLKEDLALRTIPVVMMTSSQEISDVTECYRLGVNSYVVKPVGFDEYRAMMTEVLKYWTRLNQPPVGTV